MTVSEILDDIITGVLRRELPPGLSWDQARAVAHPADKGGLTRGGITVASWAAYKGWARRATRAELNAIRETEARAFYHARYVRPFASVPEPLRSLMADWTVTSGQDDPVSALQASLQRRGVYQHRIDGVMGSKTRAAVVADPDQRRTYLDVLAARIRFYVRLALADKQVVAFRKAQPDTDLENLAGWTNRAVEFLLQLGG